MGFKKLLLVLSAAFFCAFLGGCLYPQAEKAGSGILDDAQLAMVQKAVEEYRKDNGGLLPIITKGQNTPVYQKYPIDFNKLKAPKNYLPEPPANAYESGGTFQYIIFDPEKKPTVKIYDVRIPDKIRELQIRIASQGYPPFKKEIARNVYTLDFKKLGYKKAPYVVSPYTHQKLPLVITGKGEIYVDYRRDLAKALKSSKRPFKKGEDIRVLLTEGSPYVPAYSLPYTVNEKNEPVFMAN
ncbi:hypothetical protein BpJC7_06380 [Weizmannia acidilactici]|uniref:Lipoprotein n=1 Tax=Weizmannia acidilactici TaxID=2607726 RepID=A0A5J4JFH0_9BACI|nr:hypothetical protein [Weizmannia acidilactici]GER66031.1 hypothetical protein BpJC4_05020 [Weizmannia acidilactici]GER69335.1 hypothetical protein BpJC7_06380 [Weizmannia acidilactici]GER72340.1 hypothetical protein BpPP18_04070 [Weizmannia acidilactici]